jgi:hypothetical protein
LPIGEKQLDLLNGARLWSEVKPRGRLVIEEAQGESGLERDEVVDGLTAGTISKDMKGGAVSSYLQRGKKRQLLISTELDALAGVLFDAL